jgi:predicted GNAT family acetyltransferase
MMLEYLEEKDVDRALNLIEAEDISKALYLYLDLSRYRLNNPEIIFYAKKDGEEIVAVAMKYYTGLQLFSIRQTPDVIEFVNEIIEAHDDILQIIGQQDLVRALDVDETKYRYNKNYVVERKSYEWKPLPPNFKIEKAVPENADELADFYLSDEYYAHGYTKNDLSTQLRERMEEGFGRINFIRNENGRIIYAGGTGAETDRLAITGLALVDKEYRKYWLSPSALKVLVDELLAEGKRVFAFFVGDSGPRRIDGKTVILKQIMGKYERIK